MKTQLIAAILLLNAYLSPSALSQNAQCSRNPLSVEEISAASRSIVKGKVISSETVWNEEKTLAYTHYTLRVMNYIKGKTAQEIVLVAEAADRNNPECTFIVPLVKGTEIIACLDRVPKHWECGYTPRHAYAPLGDVQGVFILHKKSDEVTDYFNRFENTDQLMKALQDETN